MCLFFNFSLDVLKFYLRTILLFASLLVLMGCTVHQHMGEGLQAMLDEKKEVAFDVLGYPTSKQVIDGMEVFVWNSGRQGVLYVPQSQVVTGVINGVTTHANVQSYSLVPTVDTCFVQMVVKDGRVIRTRYQGSERGCAGYMSLLRDFSEKKNEHNER